MPLSKYDKLSEQEKNLLRDLNNQLEQEIIDWVIKNKVSLKQAKNIVSSGFGTEYLITVLDKLIDDENFKF